MKEIPLTKDKFAIVDDEDFEYLMQWKWHFNNKGYAATHGRYHYLYMHRLIMNLQFGDKREIDHINMTPLDNRKSNLRICSRRQNLHNRIKQKNNTSGYKGICWHKASNCWIAQINKKKKQRIHLGCFKTKEDAVFVYNKAAKKYHGEFAKLNQIGG